jgi:tetratricopeptide (TPR) repeat protein
MKAIISGEAAVAAILDKGVELRPLGKEPIVGLNVCELNRVLDGCRDVRMVEVKDKAEVDRLVESAWRADRALRFFLFILDSEAEDDERREYADCLEELFGFEDSKLSVERRLFSNPIPVLLEVNRIAHTLENYPIALGVFNVIISLQGIIAKVAEAFDEVPEDSFGGSSDKSLCREMLIDDGSFREIVLAVHGSKDLNFLRLEIVAKHRFYSTAMLKFFASLQPHYERRMRPIVHEPEMDDDENIDLYDASKDGDFEAFTRVRAQQRGIVERLKLHDTVTAKRFADQLIEEQRRLSNREHIAKSLCLLAQQAKRYEATELQVEWAERANEVDPTDPMTSGHLADALICSGNFVAAYQAIEQTERRGDLLYAATSRARIRRIEGRYAEAHDLYLDAATTYDAHKEVLHAWAGVAETLRDMGKFDQSIVQYRVLIERWPDDSALRCGLASALMETGRYQDAINEFNIALHYGDNIIAQNGLATAYKLAGNMEESLAIYDDILQYSPFNSATLCGRAEVFRANDNLSAALAAYELAVERASQNPRAWAGLGHVMEELGLFEDARHTYSEGERRFPDDEYIAVGKARLLRRRQNLQEALNAFDGLSKRFPFNTWVRWARGDVLRSMGNPEAALAEMEAVLSSWPDYVPAQNLKASLLIECGRLDEALAVLESRAGGPSDWSRAILRASIMKARNQWNDALTMLTNSLNNARLPRERRFLRAAIATLDLQRGRPEAAAHLAEAKTGEITNVIYFHALAASGKAQRAKGLYERIIQSEGDQPYMGIVIEIARRFHVVRGAPSQSPEWIAQEEEKALIFEVS